MTPATSIRRRVTLTLFAVFSLALIVAATALAVYEYRSAEMRARISLVALADTLAPSLVATFDFDTPDIAAQNLARLEPSGAILGAAVFRTDRSQAEPVFAAYRRPATALEFAPTLRRAGFYRHGNRALLVHPLRNEEREVGQLSLEADVSIFRRGLRDALVLLAIVFGAVAAASLGLSGLLQRALTRPIVQLAETAARVNLTGDFSLRAPVIGHDEVGRLALTFNEMLTGIALRDGQLAAQRAFENAVVENAAVSIITTAPDGTIRTFNVAAERMLGFAREEMVGRATPVAIHDPEQLARRAALLSQRLGRPIAPGFEVFRELAAQSPSAAEWLYVRKDGTRLPVFLVVSTLRTPAGEELGLCGIATDLTERKRTEEQLRLLSEAIEQSPVVVIITDASNRIVFANERLFTASGYSRGEVLGQNPRLFSAGQHPPGLVAEMWQQLNAGLVWQGEFINRRKNGESFVVRSSITPVFGETGALQNYLAVQEDVTEARRELERRRQLETQLFQAQKMESIGALAGGIAHDFNNILTGILGFAEIAVTTLPEGHPACADLAEVRKAGLRAKDLVAQILTFSRQKASQQVPVDLARTVEDVLKLIRVSAPATIQIERRLQPAFIRADPVGIHQIVLNLCTNAVHAMRGIDGSLLVTVEPIEVTAALAACVPKLKTGAHVRLAISDNGHGMDVATQARLFEPFFTTKKTGEGTGLGLALVKGIANAHGAAIRVVSAPGAGATFELFFATCGEAEPKQAPGPSVATGGGERVLVVDDEKSVGTFVGVRLEQLNYQVDVYNDPLDALAAIRAMPTKFAVLVTDLTMPHLTGWALVRAAREVRPDLPAIVMSGYGGDEASADTQSQLAHTQVLPKPFNGDDLGRAIAEALLRNTDRPNR